MKRIALGVFVFLVLVITGGCVNNPLHREAAQQQCEAFPEDCDKLIEFLEGVLTATPGPTTTPGPTATPTPTTTSTPTPTPTVTPTPIPTPGPGPNLVINGGFESPAISGRFSRSGPGSWQITGTVDTIRTDWQPKEGSQSVDLSGTSRGKISQEIPTEPGREYRLEFWISANPRSSSPRTLQVLWGDSDDKLVETISIPVAGRTFSQMNWERRELTVRATSSTTELQFVSLDDGFHGPALDDVKVRRSGTVTTSPDGAEIRQETDLIRVRIPLRSSSTANNAPKGHAEFEAERRDGTLLRKFKVEVENLVLSSGTEIEISVSGAGVVDRFTFGGGVRFERELDTEDGHTVPSIQGGEQVCVALPGNPCGTFPQRPPFPPLP